MYINRNQMKSLSVDPVVKRDSAGANGNVVRELEGVLQQAKQHLIQSTIEKASNWMLYEDLWLQNENGTRMGQYRNYGRGDVVLSVDLGTSNIGTEIRYPHPCVVLHDQGEDWFVVVPITAASIDQTTGKPIIHQPFEVFAEQQRTRGAAGEFQFRKPSVIQVDQIKRISKYRCQNKNSLKIREDLLNAIDNKVMEYFAPKKHILLEKLKQEVNDLQQLVDVLKEQVSDVHQVNEDLKSRLAEQEELIRDLQALKDAGQAG